MPQNNEFSCLGAHAERNYGSHWAEGAMATAVLYDPNCCISPRAFILCCHPANQVWVYLFYTPTDADAAGWIHQLCLVERWAILCRNGDPVLGGVANKEACCFCICCIGHCVILQSTQPFVSLAPMWCVMQEL